MQVVQYLAGCGLQSCGMLVSKGYPDIGWNPVEGERYLDFLRFAVFCNGDCLNSFETGSMFSVSCCDNHGPEFLHSNLIRRKRGGECQCCGEASDPSSRMFWPCSSWRRRGWAAGSNEGGNRDITGSLQRQANT